MVTVISSYKLNHTMLRVKDVDKSLAFYRDLMGMKLIKEMPMEKGKFTLYFLAYDQAGAPNAGRSQWDREGLLELTHNWGTETSNWTAHSGNSDPKGFGHICISVDNVQAACDRLEEAGCLFQKKPSQGRQADIAFVLDPDGYWVEIIGQSQLKHLTTTNVGNYRFNHSMIRIKDPEISKRFYENVLGMKLVRTREFEQAKFTLFFYAYAGNKTFQPQEETGNPIADHEGLVELTWNWGTEKDPNFEYVSGNKDPQGFGHLAISVDNVEAACQRFEELGVKFQKRLSDGSMKNIAFILDPDGYWIEVVPKNM